MTTETRRTWTDVATTYERSSDYVTKWKDIQEARKIGKGPAHTDALLRVFDDVEKEEDIRVTLYRDHAAWCPYCQKVWMMLEEKRVSFRVQKINMRSYGDKPASFLAKVPRGLLPVMELDGQIITESQVIMNVIDEEFRDESKGYRNHLLPRENESLLRRMDMLLQLERELFSAWCLFLFRDTFGGGARRAFETTLDAVNDKLTETPGPWFLGGDELSMVDLVYVPHLERMAASAAFWKGVQVRGTGRWPAIDAWFNELETMPSYMATKSDYYTHVMDIPPQYGPSRFNQESKPFTKKILGQDGSWDLPLPPLSMNDLEPTLPSNDPGELTAKHEAGWKLIQNHENIARFAARGAGRPGRKQFSAPLADPYATPDETIQPFVHDALRFVAEALFDEVTATENGTIKDEVRAYFSRETTKTQRDNIIKSLYYLRDRVGVPRDLTYPAARQLRAHLNWIADILSAI